MPQKTEQTRARALDTVARYPPQCNTRRRGVPTLGAWIYTWFSDSPSCAETLPSAFECYRQLGGGICRLLYGIGDASGTWYDSLRMKCRRGWPPKGKPGGRMNVFVGSQCVACAAETETKYGDIAGRGRPPSGKLEQPNNLWF